MDGGKIAGLYDLGETLGRGHYAVVKQARHVFTGEQVAVKVIDKTKLDQVSRAHLFQEVRCMKLVQHPHVVRLYEVIDTQTKLYLILEFGDGGDMYDHIMRHDNGLSEEHARRYFGQILSAIIYCHKLHVVHRDLKPENVVFFDKLGVVKLTDFGFSNKFLPGEKLETSCGSLAYSAPEILLGDSYDAPKVDIWSLGVLLYMLVVGRAPFQEANDSETLTMIMDCKYHVPEHVSQQCKSLIGRMLVRSPEKRASLEQIAADEWLRGLDVAQLAAGPLVSREQLSEDEHQLIVHKMVQGNIASKEQIHEALEENTYDHITATYFLLAERKLRSTRLGVKTPTRGRKQMLAQPPRVAPGAQATTGLVTTATNAVSVEANVTGGTISMTGGVGGGGGRTTVSLATAPTTTTTALTTAATAIASWGVTACPSGSLHLNNNSIHIKDSSGGDNRSSSGGSIEVVANNIGSALASPTSSSVVTSSEPYAVVGAIGLTGIGANSLDALTVPSRLARKCSIVREGEEDEAGASPGPPARTNVAASATVQIDEVPSPASEEDSSSGAPSAVGSGTGVRQMLSLPTGAGTTGSASQQQLCASGSSTGDESMDSDVNQQLSPAGHPVGRKLHAVKSSPQLLQSATAAAAASSFTTTTAAPSSSAAGSPATATSPDRTLVVPASGSLAASCATGSGLATAAGAGLTAVQPNVRPGNIVAGGHNTAPRHRRLSCSSSEDDDDEDPTFRRLERSKQEEDTELEGRRRDSIAAQISRERRASALSVAATPPVATPETEALPALNLCHLVRHDSVQFMDKSDSSSVHGVQAGNETCRESAREGRKLDQFFVDPKDDVVVQAVPPSPQLTQSKSLDASMSKSISASITNNNNNNNNNHHHHHHTHHVGGKNRTKRLVDVKLASKCCSIC